MPDPSAGEVGGIFAGLVALLIALGHGIRWLMGWEERRDATRSAKLGAWQQQLAEREAKIDEQQASYQASIEARLASISATAERLQDEHAALLSAYHLVASALRASDPGNPVLRMADELLRAAFPLDPKSPTDLKVLMDKAAARLDRSVEEPK